MNFARRQLTTFRRRWRLLGGAARLMVSLLGIFVLGGGVWLCIASEGEQFVPILSGPLEASDLEDAQQVLRTGGIAYRMHQGVMLVDSGDAARARAMLESSGGGQTDPVVSFQKVLNASDVWTTEAEKNRRCIAAKMVLLSRLIGNFPMVRKATVIFEPGSSQRFRKPSTDPTAVVNVTLVPKAVMTRELIAAISDQVASSISGMRPRNVHIIDSSGRSHHPASETPGSTDSLERMRSAEQYYRDKIVSALRYVRGLSVDVWVKGDGASPRCVGASVSVPRSHLGALFPGDPTEPHDLTDEELTARGASHLSKIRKTVMGILRVEDPGAVTVDWYYDAPPFASVRSDELGGLDGALGSSDRGEEKNVSELILGGVLVLVLAGLSAYLYWRLVRKRSPRRGASLDAGQLSAFDFAGDVSDHTEEKDVDAPFAFLRDVPREQVVSLIEREPAESIALVLVHLGPGKAAGILAELSPDVQVQVVRCVAELDAPEPEAIEEIGRQLRTRLTEKGGAVSRTGGGVGKIAEILCHADYTTEQEVLEGLSGDQPELAESIRSRMFVFDDIVRIPNARLARALQMMEMEELAVALRTAGQQVRKKVLSSLRSGISKRVRSEMNRIAPVRLSDVELAQQRVMEAIRLCERGQYVQTVRSGGSMVVA